MLQEKSYQSTGTQRKVRKGLPETTIKNLKEELLGELKLRMKFGYVEVRKLQVKGTSYPQMYN